MTTQNLRRYFRSSCTSMEDPTEPSIQDSTPGRKGPPSLHPLVRHPSLFPRCSSLLWNPKVPRTPWFPEGRQPLNSGPLLGKRSCTRAGLCGVWSIWVNRFWPLRRPPGWRHLSSLIGRDVNLPDGGKVWVELAGSISFEGLAGAPLNRGGRAGPSSPVFPLYLNLTGAGSVARLGTFGLEERFGGADLPCFRRSSRSLAAPLPPKVRRPHPRTPFPCYQLKGSFYAVVCYQNSSVWARRPNLRLTEGLRHFAW